VGSNTEQDPEKIISEMQRLSKVADKNDKVLTF
jgi:hypothetical protein